VWEATLGGIRSIPSIDDYRNLWQSQD